MYSDISSVAYNIMMRDIMLRTSASEKSDNNSVRLVDSRGRKPANNKISIYSQKYTPQQEPPQVKTQHINNPSIRTAIIGKKQDNTIKLYQSHEKPLIATTNIQLIDVKQETLSPKTLSHYLSLKNHYDAKIRQITQQNARIITQLSNLLVYQQQRIAQKQQTIAKIINTQQTQRVPIGKNLTVRLKTAENPNRVQERAVNLNAHHEYFTNKIKDLQASIKIIIEHFSTSEDKINERLQTIEKQIIRYFSGRINSLASRLGQYAQQFQSRCKVVEEGMVLKTKRAPSLGGEMEQKLRQMARDIANFASKQFFYQNQRVSQLQVTLQDLRDKLDSLEKSGSRRVNGFFLQDEDEFFYPSSERKVYQPDDEYQHFQSQSEDEHSPHLTKENISSNSQTVQKEKIKF